MIGKIKLSKGKSYDIDGIIQEYTVANNGNVNAGDFVKFVNSYSLATRTQLSTLSYNICISAVQISTDKIFIVTREGDDQNLIGLVCTISGNTISAGVQTQLSTIAKSGSHIKVLRLSDNKVFILYSGDATELNLSGMFCEISGTTITIKENIQISEATNSAINASATALSSTRIFITYNNNGYTVGVVYILNISELVKGKETNLLSVTDSNILRLSDSKAFIASRKCVVCSISGTAITVGVETNQINTGSSFKVEMLSQNKVFITYHNASGSQYVFGMICNIDEASTITSEIETQLSTYEAFLNSSYLSISKWMENIVCIAYADKTSRLRATLCNVKFNTIKIEDELFLRLTTYAPAVCLVSLSKSKMLILHTDNASQSLYALIENANFKIETISSSEDEIAGIAKSSSSSGSTVQVIVPNV